jgi:serine/threonine-protein kinase RsbW
VIRRRHLTRSAELESLPVFRAFVASVCQEEGIDEATTFDLQLSVDEACTNIITYGYAGIDPGSIIVTMQVERQRVVIVITDFGHPFEPGETPLPEIEAALEDRPMGGFGLYFIYQTCDTVDYETTDEGNRLTLVKLRGDRGAAVAA